MYRVIRAVGVGLLAIVAVVLNGCNVGAISTDVINDVEKTAAAIQDNQQLIQQAASEIQSKGLPESAEYRELRDQYITARGLANAYLGHMAVAAVAGDQNTDLAVTATAAHTAATKFIQNATHYLDPSSASRGIAFGQVVRMLPTTTTSIAKVLAALGGAGEQQKEIKNYYNTFRWKGWDELAEIPAGADKAAASASRGVRPKKLNRGDLWNPKGLRLGSFTEGRN